MSQYRVCIDSFSGALGDLPKKSHRDDAAVLVLLSEHPRFSCFDMTPALGRTLDRLKKAGRLRYPHQQPEYPWVVVETLPD